MKTTAEKIAVMQAAMEADYKGLQIKGGLDREWCDWTAIVAPNWNWDLTDYRMKPEPPKEPFSEHTLAPGCSIVDVRRAHIRAVAESAIPPYSNLQWRPKCGSLHGGWQDWLQFAPLDHPLWRWDSDEYRIKETSQAEQAEPPLTLEEINDAVNKIAACEPPKAAASAQEVSAPFNCSKDLAERCLVALLHSPDADFEVVASQAILLAQNFADKWDICRGVTK